MEPYMVAPSSAQPPRSALHMLASHRAGTHHGSPTKRAATSLAPCVLSDPLDGMGEAGWGTLRRSVGRSVRRGRLLTGRSKRGHWQLPPRPGSECVAQAAEEAAQIAGVHTEFAEQARVLGIVGVDLIGELLSRLLGLVVVT